MKLKMQIFARDRTRDTHAKNTHVQGTNSTKWLPNMYFWKSFGLFLLDSVEKRKQDIWFLF